MDEIEQRALAYGRPALSMHEVADLAGISRVSMWRLPPDERPKFWRAGGSDMLMVDDAIEWARDYRQRRTAK